MDTIESIENEGKHYQKRVDACLSRSPDHLICMAIDGTTVQDCLGRLLFRLDASTKPGDILSKQFNVIDKRTPQQPTHTWNLHFKVLRPVTFNEVKALAKHSLYIQKTNPLPGKWYEVHAD